MRRRAIYALVSFSLAAAAMGAAVTAPAEVIENLEFFSDLDLLVNLDLMEDEEFEAPAVSTAAPVRVSTAAFSVKGSSAPVIISTTVWRSYEKR